MPTGQQLTPCAEMRDAYNLLLTQLICKFREPRNRRGLEAGYSYIDDE
jgi:hypothetical protein